MIVLRGPAGAGKTTLAEKLRDAIPGRSAVVDTDIFSWQCVPGESDKQVVYENVLLVAENYLRHGYAVVVSGLIITTEEAGAMDRLRSLAATHRVPFGDFYCSAPLAVVCGRNAARSKDVPDELVRLWWTLAEQDRTQVGWPLIELDMEQPLGENVRAVLDAMTSASPT